MNSVTIPDEQPDPIDKGKARAQEATERTPLLTRPSPSFTPPDDSPTPVLARRTLCSKLTFVFLVSLSACVVVFVALALLAYSYASYARSASPEDLLNNALVFRGPDRVDVLNLTSEGAIWVNVEGRMGLDAGTVLGVRRDPDNDGFFRGIWKSMGRWGVRRVDRVAVDVTAVNISLEHDPSTILTSVEPSPMDVPLTADSHPDKSWLIEVSIPLLIRPTSNTSTLIQFVRDSWHRGSIAVQVHIGRAAVRGGALDEYSWRRKLRGEVTNIKTALHIIIPPFPGLPNPGRNTPFPSFPELVTLQSFSVSTESNKLILNALATIIDPAPLTFNFTSPSIPFIISLSSASSSPHIQIASVSTHPFSLTHPNITLVISGRVLPLPSSASTILSTFITRYLSGQSNDILISPSLIPGLSIETVFPAPNPRPRILRNVTIHDMRIKPTGPGGTFLASGTVFARVVLPKGVNVKLDVHRVLPDVLIFDGEVPGSIELPYGPPSSPHLPDPLPERAFAHIRPDDWLTSLSVLDEPQDGEGSAFAVTAKIVDVPLEVLPGRQTEFSKFVSKVIFGSRGAVAGILGSAAVALEVEGLPFRDGPGSDGDVELSGLPFQGSVLVGRKSLFSEKL